MEILQGQLPTLINNMKTSEQNKREISKEKRIQDFQRAISKVSGKRSGEFTVSVLKDLRTRVAFGGSFRENSFNILFWKVDRMSDY